MSAERICQICDGGPANESACICGHEAWGTSTERTKIVAWLRSYAGCLIRDQERALLAAANAIERGDHLAKAIEAGTGETACRLDPKDESAGRRLRPSPIRSNTMSNPDSSTPSIHALDLAVKPAGYSSWEQFRVSIPPHFNIRQIALAYAADLDKADKVGRMVRDMSKTRTGIAALAPRAMALLLPDEIDPDLLEAEKIVAAVSEGGGRHGFTVNIALSALRRGRELAKEQQ